MPIYVFYKIPGRTGKGSVVRKRKRDDTDAKLTRRLYIKICEVEASCKRESVLKFNDYCAKKRDELKSLEKAHKVELPSKNEVSMYGGK